MLLLLLILISRISHNSLSHVYLLVFVLLFFSRLVVLHLVPLFFLIIIIVIIILVYPVFVTTLLIVSCGILFLVSCLCSLSHLSQLYRILPSHSLLLIVFVGLCCFIVIVSAPFYHREHLTNQFIVS